MVVAGGGVMSKVPYLIEGSMSFSSANYKQSLLFLSPLSEARKTQK